MRAVKVKARKMYYCSKCRKEIPVGEEYYSITGFKQPSRKHCTKCGVSRADMTSSEFLKWLFNFQDSVRNTYPEEEGIVDDLDSELQDQIADLEEKISNLPENLQYAPIGECLQERLDALQSASDELSCLDYPDEDDYESEEEFNSAKDEYFSECYRIIEDICCG